MSNATNAPSNGGGGVIPSLVDISLSNTVFDNSIGGGTTVIPIFNIVGASYDYYSEAGFSLFSGQFNFTLPAGSYVQGESIQSATFMLDNAPAIVPSIGLSAVAGSGVAFPITVGIGSDLTIYFNTSFTLAAASGFGVSVSYVST